MIKCSTLFDLEMNCLDDLTRKQLVEAVSQRSDCLPVDLLERVEEQETDQLRLLLFAARLIHALRQLRTTWHASVAVVK
jgi:hypothetical protein